MTINKSDSVSGGAGNIPAVTASTERVATRVRANDAPKKESLEKKPKAAPAPEPKIAKSAEKTDNTVKTTPVDSGKYNDYRVNSENELIISVKNRQTNEEIRQIPTKRHQAVKHAISETIEHLIDKTV